MMSRCTNSLACGAAALALLGAGPARAQEGAARTANPSPFVAAARFVKRPIGQVAARLSEVSGVRVVFDKTVAVATVTLEAPPGPLEATLDRVAAALPAGTVVKKVLLPAPAPGAPAPDGDQVAALAAAQEALAAPSAKEPAPVLGPGEVNILGKRLSAEKAAPVIAALDLRPVYLLTNPKAGADPVQKMNTAQAEGLKLWLNMTPEQQKAAAEQQLDGLMNMDPALRQQLFSQQRQVMAGFMQRIQSMPPDQRAQFFRDLTGGAWDGTGTPPRGALPGGGNQGPGQPPGGPGQPPGGPGQQP